jgi:hypothetical protein
MFVLRGGGDILGAGESERAQDPVEGLNRQKSSRVTISMLSVSSESSAIQRAFGVL